MEVLVDRGRLAHCFDAAFKFPQYSGFRTSQEEFALDRFGSFSEH